MDYMMQHLMEQDMDNGSNDYVSPYDKFKKMTQQTSMSAFKYIVIGAIVIAFSPVILPVYFCYAVGKTVMQYWDKL